MRKAGLFFQEDLPSEMANDVLFMPDENAAFEEVHKPGHKSARIRDRKGQRLILFSGRFSED